MIARALCLTSLLAACDHHPGFPNGTPDAAPADTLPTAGDAGPDAVTLTVTVHGAPMPGVAVYFQSADSQLVLGAVTDEHGTAGAMLGVGGYATVIEPEDGTGITRLATIAATRPRDALHLDLAPSGAVDATTFAVTVPIVPGAVGYQIYTSCGQFAADASGMGSEQLLGCGGAADILVMAIDGTAAIEGCLYVPGVPVGSEPATLSGLYSRLVATSFAYEGVPAPNEEVSTSQTIATARGSLFSASTSAPAAAGHATNALDMPMVTSAFALTISEALPVVTDHGEQRIFDWGPQSSAYTLDVASAMLPVFTAMPTYDLATRSISWGERSGGTPPDLVRARIHVFRNGIPEGKSWTWAIVAPRGAGPSVAFPRLPAGSFDFNPGAGDAVDVDDLLTASVPVGYDGVRAHGFDDLSTFVAGPGGRMVVETLFAPVL
jgi:hypothetical protein